MNSNRDEYLKVLYEEGGAFKPVQNKVIAEKLNIAPASVSDMLQKLDKEEIVELVSYKGALLTEKGLSSCLNLVQNHRLWEVFLIKHLGYSYREAHEDAHLLEHINNDRLRSRLDKFLNYPVHCPHGSIIPRTEEDLKETSNLVKLADLKVGQKAKLVKLEEEGALLDYLQDKGIQIEEDVEILTIGEYEGLIRFNHCNKEISISYKAAEKVFCIL